MKRLFLSILTLSLLLSGCTWMDGSYHAVTPYLRHPSDAPSAVVEVENYLELRAALEDMVSSGAKSCVINVDRFPADKLEQSLELAQKYIRNTFPMGAYALESLEFDQGTMGAADAVAVKATYLHTQTELQSIKTLPNMEQAGSEIRDALGRYAPSLVMLVENYESRDLQQLAEDYAAENPDIVMETPEITVTTYPETGHSRILELRFTYQTNRDALRSMQEQVERVFDSASLYVSRDAEESQKFAQLFSFLMERFPEYQIKTSITPAYSLLNHGVGDSKTFALVYARMCREAGLNCQTVVGAKNGEPWFWNIIQVDGYYYHVDLLACQESGSYQELTDSQMANYVWDYSAYPACVGKPPEPVTEEATSPMTEETAPPSEPPVMDPQNPLTPVNPTEPTVNSEPVQ